MADPSNRHSRSSQSGTPSDGRPNRKDRLAGLTVPSPFLTTLSDGLRNAVVEAGRRHTYRRGEMLFRENDPSDFVFVVEQGGVLLVQSSVEGLESALDWACAGDQCGLEDVAGGRPYALSARATAPTVAVRFHVARLRAVVDQYAHDASFTLAVVDYLTFHVAHYYQIAAAQVEMLSCDNLAARVRKTLARLAKKMGNPPVTVDLPMTQGDLAALVGASRQRVNRVLAEMQAQGAIECLHYRIRLSDLDSLGD